MTEKRITFKGKIDYHDWNMILDFLDHNGFDYEVQFIRSVDIKRPSPSRNGLPPQTKPLADLNQ